MGNLFGPWGLDKRGIGARTARRGSWSDRGPGLLASVLLRSEWPIASKPAG